MQEPVEAYSCDIWECIILSEIQWPGCWHIKCIKETLSNSTLRERLIMVADGGTKGATGRNATTLNSSFSTQIHSLLISPISEIALLVSEDLTPPPSEVTSTNNFMPLLFRPCSRLSTHVFKEREVM